MEPKNPLQIVFLYGIFAVFFILIVCMMFPFATIFLWTALLYVLIRPAFQKCTSKLKSEKKFYDLKRHFIAGVFSIGTLLLIIVPLAVLTTILIEQLISFLKEMSNFIETQPEFISKSKFATKLGELSIKTGIGIPNFDLINIRDYLLSLINTYNTKLFLFGRNIAGGIGNFLVSMLFIVFALYFCFLDGTYLLALIARIIPIKQEHMSVLTQKFTHTTRSLFSGYILVAMYQGVVSFVLMTIFGVKGSLLFSALLMVSSFIPIFGAALVWIPVGIALCVTTSLLKGFVFLIMAGIGISFLDNFLRPLFLKDRIHVHPLVIFFSILGGIKFFGMNGLILGPIIIIIFFTLLDILSNKNDLPILN